MSELADKIQKDLVAAMKNRDELKLSTLRMLKAAMQLAMTEKGHKGDLKDDEFVALVRRLIKQRVEAAELYKKGGANDRAESELAEVKVLESYMPAQLSDDEIAEIVAKTAEALGVKGPKDMGKLMGKTMAAVKGKADGSKVREIVQQYLSKLVK